MNIFDIESYNVRWTMIVDSKLHKTTNYLWNRFLCEQSCAAVETWNGTTAELQ